MILVSLSIITIILYITRIWSYIIGWRNVPSFEPKGIDELDFSVSVIVPCKNEQENIMKLISCLAQQSYQKFELIIVNDHSSDGTRNYIKSAQTNFSNITLLDAVNHGKKNALKEGISAATSELIITLDADCMPSYHWVEAIATFQQRYNCDLIICPVGISDKDDLFSIIQALEFSSLAGVAAGAVGSGKPILCNGANLAFKKDVWLKAEKNLRQEVQSGDDIFLLETIKRYGGRIRFLKSEAAFVKTKPPRTLREFITQRQRWAGKSKFYKDIQMIYTAFLILALCTMMILTLLATLYKWQFIFVSGSLFILKYTIDTRFLYIVRRFFQLDRIWIYSLVLSTIYPFYVVFVGLSSLIIKPGQWK